MAGDRKLWNGKLNYLLLLSRPDIYTRNRKTLFPEKVSQMYNLALKASFDPHWQEWEIHIMSWFRSCQIYQNKFTLRFIRERQDNEGNKKWQKSFKHNVNNGSMIYIILRTNQSLSIQKRIWKWGCSFYDCPRQPHLPHCLILKK